MNEKIIFYLQKGYFFNEKSIKSVKFINFKNSIKNILFL